jgi:hypothetical protein
VKLIAFLSLVVGISACHDEPPVRPVSALAAGVRVGKAEPPPGARLVGEVEGSDGQGCGILGDRGSLENATTAIKEAAARRGATYVKLTEETSPYNGRDCVHLEYELRGLAYALGGEAAPVPAPLVAVTAVAPPAATAPPAVSACTPPCSPGYACNAAGVCVAECNPPCAAGQTCRADRVCVSAAP